MADYSPVHAETYLAGPGQCIVDIEEHKLLHGPVSEGGGDHLEGIVYDCKAC